MAASKSSQPEIQKALLGAPYYASELLIRFVRMDLSSIALSGSEGGGKVRCCRGQSTSRGGKGDTSESRKIGDCDKDFDKVPAIVFPEQTDEEQQSQMRIYLGVHHVLRFREWPPIAKAQFLEREIQRVGSLETTIKEVRIKKQEARRFSCPSGSWRRRIHPSRGARIFGCWQKRYRGRA